MLAQFRRLSAYRTEPAFRDDIDSIRGTVGELDAEIDLLIQDCQEQHEPARAADEANRLADEIEAEAKQP